MITLNTLDKFLREIILEGFPELGSVKVRIAFSSDSDPENTPFGELNVKGFFFKRHYKIVIDESLGMAKYDVLKGVIAHEIGHIYDDVHRNLFREICQILQMGLGKYVTKTEREVDMLVVKRGFGEQLYAFLKYADRRRHAYEKEDGLTLKEVKKLLK